MAASRVKHWLQYWSDPILQPARCLPLVPKQAAPENAEHLLNRLDLLLRQRLRVMPSGDKRSFLRGLGLDFDQLREYQPGDDFRKLDWSTLARTGIPHIRSYQEEKQMTIWFVLDLTGSMRFGHTVPKMERLLELTGLLGLLLSRSGHKLGAALITNSAPVQLIQPCNGRGHLQHIISRIQQGSTNAEPSLRPVHTNALSDAFSALGGVIAKQSSVFILSDFWSESDQWLNPLGQLSRKTRCVNLQLFDPVECAFPTNIGTLPLRDSETGKTIAFDTDNAALVTSYKETYERRQQTIAVRLQGIGLHQSVSTQAPSIDALAALLLKPALWRGNR